MTPSRGAGPDPAAAYDAVPYPAHVYPETHPDRLATLAVLRGMEPPPAERARVLELGCGDGRNLIAMAYALPRATFVGLDIAPQTVARGRREIAALGLKNVALEVGDLLTAEISGRFDYVVAHGLYSWVPPAVRDRMLGLCRECLSEQGVAYISYNAYPGNHVRDMVRSMMKYHLGRPGDTGNPAGRAKELLRYLAEGSRREHAAAHALALSEELERIQGNSEAGFFHDDLSSENRAFYFHEFMAEADAHGLQFVSEASLSASREIEFSDSVRATLSQLSQGDVLRREQYLDFLKGRAFRRTLLCRKEVRLDRTITPERLASLRVAAQVRPARTAGERGDDGVEEFEGHGGTVIGTARPSIKSALRHLGTRWPGRVPFLDLVGLSVPGTASAATVETERRAMAEFFLRACALDFVELHRMPAPFAGEVSGRPLASRLARHQLAGTATVTTLSHQDVRIEDSPARHLIRLLDGTRDRAALLDALCAAAAAGGVEVGSPGALVTEESEVRQWFDRDLDRNLAAVMRLGLLES